jgi:large subunit ribosomal protein L9
MNVQVILNDDVLNLGHTGDVVKVRAGFARNYLLPRQLAVMADAKNIRAFENQKRIALTRRETKRGGALKLKEQIEALTIAIGAHAGEEGKLFGSVTNIDIERALLERGVQIERRRILLVEPIKQLGEFVVPVRLEADIEANLKLTVSAE